MQEKTLKGFTLQSPAPKVGKLEIRDYNNKSLIMIGGVLSNYGQTVMDVVTRVYEYNTASFEGMTEEHLRKHATLESWADDEGIVVRIEKEKSVG